MKKAAFRCWNAVSCRPSVYQPPAWKGRRPSTAHPLPRCVLHPSGDFRITLSPDPQNLFPPRRRPLHNRHPNSSKPLPLDGYPCITVIPAEARTYFPFPLGGGMLGWEVIRVAMTLRDALCNVFNAARGLPILPSPVLGEGWVRVSSSPSTETFAQPPLRRKPGPIFPSPSMGEG